MSATFPMPYIIGGVLGLAFAFKILWAALRSHLVAKHSCVGDIADLGKPRAESEKIRGTAVVAGGSYAGLAAACVLHDHFERVVIIEPEAWLLEEDARRAISWEQEGKRARIVQYHSLQATQPFVLRALRCMFPNWDATCKEGGIEIAPWTVNFMWWGNSAIVPTKEFGGSIPDAMWATRRALETAMRRRVLDRKAYPNITQIVGQVTGLITDKSRGDAISGCTYRDADGNSNDMHAVFVADCTGTAQGSLKWLPAAGWSTNIPKVTYDAKMRYTTFMFKIRPELAAKLPVPGGFYRRSGGYLANMPDPRNDNKHLSILRNEGDLLSVCPGGWGNTGPPLKNIDDILAHCKAMKVTKPLPQWVFDTIDMLREAEDDMSLSQVNVGPSFLVKFHECRDLPNNFVALGDVVSRVNPMYGHGCAKAITGAICMNILLQRTRNSQSLPRNFSRDFFKMQLDKITPMWELSVLNDYGQPSTVPIAGENKSSTDGIRWYLRQVQKLSFKDADAFLPTFLAVSLLGGTNLDLLHPAFIAKVMWNTLMG